MMLPVSSWGLLSKDLHEVIPLNDPLTSQKILSGFSNRSGISHGMGRSYGDICLNSNQKIWLTTGLNRFISFNQDSGILRCESGVLLKDIQELFIPRGWMLPVTPGTQMVTVGGAIANDVHGKNHHVAGSFGNHINSIKLFRTNGEIIICSPNSLPDWFSATIGGMGLTGIIFEVEIQLKRVSGPWLDTETIPYSTINEFFNLADDSEKDWEHTVSWVDCLSKKGRGIFMRANPRKMLLDKRVSNKKDIKMLLTPPFSMVNSLTLRPFNFTYYHLKKWQSGKRLCDYKSFFYPLDGLLEWNKIYGRHGFYQYQSVIPREIGQEAITAMIGEISGSGAGSFLAVLKTFGNKNSLGMMGFPRPGVTLALDFPNLGSQTVKLFERLDAITKEAGGAIYPAKDALMSRILFETGYPRLSEFIKFRDPGISSNLSRRLMGN